MTIDNDAARSSVLLSVDAASLATDDTNHTRYLRSRAFLDATTYPLIVIRSTDMRHADWDTVHDGLVTIRGVTHPQAIHVHELASSNLESGATSQVGLLIAFSLHWRSFGITGVPASGRRALLHPQDAWTFNLALIAAMGRQQARS
jgi:polyisoprenoid-binding protein YceI